MDVRTPKNIKIAKQHAYKENLNINYFISNIDKLKLRKKYDVILLLEVIEHLNCWEEIIKKVNGYLKPGGILIISSIDEGGCNCCGVIAPESRFCLRRCLLHGSRSSFSPCVFFVKV